MEKKFTCYLCTDDARRICRITNQEINQSELIDAIVYYNKTV